MPPLTPLEARLLGVLVEKEKTTPDVYPLTVNSLASGCNQKSSREPVMNVSESEIQAALEDLRGRLLVLETYGASGRVLRYAQNFGKIYGLPSASVALLTGLMLRGAQTVSELRANCERLYHFDDASSVEAYLEELAQRSSGALVSKLPKQAGSRERRWAHLLCGDHPLQAAAAEGSKDGEPGSLQQRVERLEQEMSELRAELRALSGEITRL
ncbi:YceH family protein [Propionivibrio sp.]|uniref:YceH family protein n=1 Tax=Propionivibrio sp. TaxID=2212460 RepID=UPI00260B90CF|nr:YceH family protein [Propionivibrio sp.]